MNSVENPNPLFSDDEICSVSEFLRRCQNDIEAHIPSCWISGELSNLYRAKSGHIYFSLKDENSQIKCVLFRLNQRQLNFELENNISFLIHAKASIYQDRGEFQVIVEKIEPMGLGSLQLAFEQLKKRLMREHLFDPIYKKPLPTVVKSIGVVTAFSGAVINDICKVLKRRYPLAHIFIYDTLVQGKTAAASIARAIDCADQQKRCDVIIVARGGGSLEDLWAFNEEVVVRSIFNCQTPIISAIGHQANQTLADAVADLSAATPSVAAEMVSPDSKQLINTIEQYRYQLNQRLQHAIQSRKQQLHHIHKRLIKPLSLIRYHYLKVDELSLRLRKNQQQQYHTLTHIVGNVLGKLHLLAPHQQLNTKQTKYNELTKRLHQQITQSIQSARHTHVVQQQKLKTRLAQQYNHQDQSLAKLSKLLDAFSPLATLARGYSLTFNHQQTLIGSINEVKKGDTIVSKLKDGVITSSVSIVHPLK